MNFRLFVSLVSVIVAAPSFANDGPLCEHGISSIHTVRVATTLPNIEQSTDIRLKNGELFQDRDWRTAYEPQGHVELWKSWQNGLRAGKTIRISQCEEAGNQVNFFDLWFWIEGDRDVALITCHSTVGRVTLSDFKTCFGKYLQIQD